MIYIKLFFEFFKIGLFSIGGGNATIPFLEVLSDSTGWFSRSDLLRFIAISESTPGAIGVNMATFSGFLASNNILGALAATLGLITPSVIIIIIISMSMQKFQSSEKVKFAFYGLRPASTALITAVLISLTLHLGLVNLEVFSSDLSLIDMILNFFSIKNCLIAIVLGSIIFKHKAHPLFYILIAAFIGILLKV